MAYKRSEAMTYQQLLERLRTMTPEQLAHPVIWQGDDRGGYVGAVDVLDKDWVNPECEGWEPRADFIKRMVEEEGEEERAAAEAEMIVGVKGQPYLMVDE